jgi:hypothetical protein
MHSKLLEKEQHKIGGQSKFEIYFRMASFSDCAYF